MPHGYSGTPLVKKLGLKSGMVISVYQPPDNYADLLGEMPEDIRNAPMGTPEADWIHLFCKDTVEFEQNFLTAKDLIRKNGMIWVSWYKKSAKIPTDLNEDVIRDFALANGLVDVKVCAVDDKWSGLKIVWRKENRGFDSAPPPGG